MKVYSPTSRKNVLVLYESCIRQKQLSSKWHLYLKASIILGVVFHPNRNNALMCIFLQMLSILVNIINWVNDKPKNKRLRRIIDWRYLTTPNIPKWRTRDKHKIPHISLANQILHCVISWLLNSIFEDENLASSIEFEQHRRDHNEGGKL